MPLDSDTDNDGLLDGQEIALSTNPLLVDTDGDGEGDGAEFAQGTNPTQSSSNSISAGVAAVNGTKEAIYGSPVSIQTVQTEFGDNFSEWDAAYAQVKNGRLILMLTGNLVNDGARLEIFIDSTNAITSNVLNAVGTTPPM